jgi:D-alanyl-D-alanine carboxypeptidase
MEEGLLSSAMLAQMKTWVTDSKGNPRYGLGLSYSVIQGHEAFGHSGGGIGAGCELYYFPEKQVFVFIAINLGTVTDSPLHAGASAVRDKIFATILE